MLVAPFRLASSCCPHFLPLREPVLTDLVEPFHPLSLCYLLLKAAAAVILMAPWESPSAKEADSATCPLVPHQL